MADIHFGVARPEDVAGLSGLEMLQAMMAGKLPAAPIGQTMSFRLIEASPGRAVFQGTPGPELLNPLGSVHGGWALTLIDSATGCAVHTTLPAGVGYTTVETKANMTKAIRQDGKPIRCEGQVVAQGRQIVTAEAKVLDEAGTIYAHGTSTLMILRPR